MFWIKISIALSLIARKYLPAYKAPKQSQTKLKTKHLKLKTISYLPPLLGQGQNTERLHTDN